MIRRTASEVILTAENNHNNDIATVPSDRQEPVYFEIDASRTDDPYGANTRFSFYIFQTASLRRLSELFAAAVAEREILGG